MRNRKAALALVSASALFVLAGCETVASEVNEAVGFEYVAALSGGSGSGKAKVSLNDATNMLCTDLELSSGVNMTAGHVIGPGGEVLADIDVPKDNDSDDCDNITDAQLDSIKANPGNYRVHIAATGGDLMGTLRKK